MRLLALIAAWVFVMAPVLAQNDEEGLRLEAAQRLVQRVDFTNVFPGVLERVQALLAAPDSTSLRHLDAREVMDRALTVALVDNLSGAQMADWGEQLSSETGRKVFEKQAAYRRELKERLGREPSARDIASDAETGEWQRRLTPDEREFLRREMNPERLAPLSQSVNRALVLILSAEAGRK